MDRTLPGADHEQVKEHFKERYTGPYPGPGPETKSVRLSDRSINPKVPTTAFSVVSGAIVIEWLADLASVPMDNNVALALAGLIGALAGYAVAFRAD